MADWRLLRLHRLEASFHTLKHKELDRTRRQDLQYDDDARLAFIDWMDAGPKSVLANNIRLLNRRPAPRQPSIRRRQPKNNDDTMTPSPHSPAALPVVCQTGKKILILERANYNTRLQS